MGWIRKAGRRVCLAACAMGLAFGLAACQKQPSWQEQYDLGMRYLTESNYQEAIIAFTAAMKVNPQQVDTYVYLAQVYLASGDPETAQQILTQGYDVTRDGRLDTSSVDAWFLYNPSLAFDQQLAYRDFDLLSADQQETVRQAAAAAKAGQGEDVQTLLAESNLPPQLFTRLDGEQVELTVLPETDDPLYLKAYQAMSDQYLEEVEAQQEDYQTGTIQQVGQFQVLTVRPENGTEYCWCSQNITYGIPYEGETQSVTVQAEAFQTSECENGQYNGSWKSQGTIWTGNTTDAYTYVETSGTAAGGEKFQDGPMILKNVGDGIQTVYTYQGDQLMECYMEDLATGERVDMMDAMNALASLQDRLTG